MTFRSLVRTLFQIPVFTLGLPLFLLYFYCQPFLTVPDKVSSASQKTGQSPPVILELRLSSNNNCRSSYAIDCDQVTLEFTTSRPCYSLSSVWLSDSYLLSCPKQDFCHWICIWQLQQYALADQEQLWATELLNDLFPNGYLYYGPNSSITYFAPLKLSYSLQLPEETNDNTSALSNDSELTIYANHPIQFLPIETFEQNGIKYMAVNMTDPAGNGPLCILLPLNRELLAQLPALRDCQAQTDVESFISYCIPLEGIV